MKNILFVSLILFSFSLQAENSPLQFSNGWIKQLPPVVPMRAGYIQIKNSSSEPRRIVSIQSDAFDTVEMHETTMADGMMKMIQLDGINIAPKSNVELKPGSKHLMLIDPKRALQIGDKVDLIITFANKNTQSVQLVVKK